MLLVYEFPDTCIYSNKLNLLKILDHLFSHDFNPIRVSLI